MLIKCNAREHDNVVRVGLTTYHFKKNDSGDLVCDVQDDEAANKLLQSPEFEPYEEEEGDIFEEVVSAPPGHPYSGKTYEELLTAYREKFGRAAHPQTKYETLLEKLEE